jgi:hypothetical protein
MLGPNSLPFVQSLDGGGASLYFPSAWTRAPRPVQKCDAEGKNTGSKPRSDIFNPDDNESTWLRGEQERDRHTFDSYDIPRQHLGIPIVDISQSSSPQLPSSRSRHTPQPLTPVPPSPSLPIISPDAPVSRLSPPQLRPSGIWAELADNKTLNTQEFWLVLYFVFNLSLTLYNKGVLVQFPFPYTLTALHALCGAVGGWSLWAQGAFVPKQLSATDNVSLVTFSILYAMNIAVSNVSLNLVTVPFHQVVRAATPIFTLALSTMMFGTRFSLRRLASLIPVMVGLGFATYGDYYATVWGLLLTLLGTFLAALKTIFTNVLQSNSAHIPSKSSSPLLPPALSLHPLDLLTRMCPLAFIQCVFYALLNGELDQVREWSSHEMTWFKAAGLLVNGCIAFGLNVVSFTANKKAGALSMTVAANIKQVLTILSAVLLFDLDITLMNGAGIIFTLAGGAWYGYVDYEEKRRRRDRERTLMT